MYTAAGPKSIPQGTACADPSLRGHFVARHALSLQFLMLRVDAGTRPEEQILACCSEEDTMLVFLLDYDDVEFKITKQRQRQSKAQPDNKSLYLRSSDGDSHGPFLLHVRGIDLPSGHRQRSYAAQQRRRQNKRRKEGGRMSKLDKQENKVRKHALKNPLVRTHR